MEQPAQDTTITFHLDEDGIIYFPPPDRTFEEHLQSFTAELPLLPREDAEQEGRQCHQPSLALWRLSASSARSAVISAEWRFDEAFTGNAVQQFKAAVAPITPQLLQSIGANDGGEMVEMVEMDAETADLFRQSIRELRRLRLDLNRLSRAHYFFSEEHRQHCDMQRRLQRRPRQLCLSPSGQTHALMDALLSYASHPEEVLAQSAAAFAELFAALRSGNIEDAYRFAPTAVIFSRREHAVRQLLSQGQLVASEPQ